MAKAASRWDVFCRVVDNFGDAGVCWRLARLLAVVHGCAVTLWIDDLRSLARILPGIDPERQHQTHDGVRLRRLADPFAGAFDAPDVVVEAFGCGLPAPYEDALERRRSLWITLEYLSAEPWVDGAHARPSPPPARNIERWFWFPGFTPATGGLLREPGLVEAREAWQAQATAPGATLTVSLFCYPNAALPALFDAWAEGDELITCLVPEGVATAALDQWLGGAVLEHGETRRRGDLTLASVPFVPQDDYDRRLWSCDLNFVRGEDSFVRAQWAARPFVWHPYPQAENAQSAKLAAFADRYVATLTPTTADALRRMWQAFDCGDGAATAAAWPAFRAALPELTVHGRDWAAALQRLPELATGLVRFAEKRYNLRLS
jgi:uncharacterized repeat protein (TIGR03837 family)